MIISRFMACLHAPDLLHYTRCYITCQVAILFYSTTLHTHAFFIPRPTVPQRFAPSNLPSPITFPRRIQGAGFTLSQTPARTQALDRKSTRLNSSVHPGV